MIWQALMNHGPKFLQGTIGDAQKKFGGPESFFWVSNNNLVKTLKPKIAKMVNFRPFFNL